MEYKIVCATAIPKISIAVANMIKEGWVPQGGPSMIQADDAYSGALIIQAMVRYNFKRRG